MNALEIDIKARAMAIKNNQVYDFGTNEVGKEGDYFITLQQLSYILASLLPIPNEGEKKQEIDD